jgi:calcineurin-like phosphoesterase family protein
VFKKAKNNTVLNVGVDQWGFYPVSIEEVRREFENI